LVRRPEALFRNGIAAAQSARWRGPVMCACVRVRTQASLAVSAGDGRWTLINASPDLGAWS
jgi:hypothetical protein